MPPASSDLWLNHCLYCKQQAENGRRKIAIRRRRRRCLLFLSVFAVSYYYGNFPAALVMIMVVALANLEGGEALLLLAGGLALLELSRLGRALWQHCRAIGAAIRAAVVTASRPAATPGAPRRDPWLDRASLERRQGVAHQLAGRAGAPVAKR